MYEHFNMIIEIYGAAGNGPLDSWYDLSWKDAYDALAQFDEEDWNKLKEELPHKSNKWKECMVFCFDDDENQHEVDILNSLANTEDEHLLIMVADMIRLYFRYDKILSIQTIIQRISEIIDHVGPVSQIILYDFLKKAENT